MTQAEALAIMKSGANVFLTGPPGAGKTYVLNEFIEWAEDEGKDVAVTASTGIAASHIGGTTIHSWSGLGIRDTIDANNLRWYETQDRFVERFESTDVLIIDEVSMLHNYRLDMVNKVLKHIRANPEPFGGMQVILVGDLFQLPPVTRSEGNELFDRVAEPNFVHTSKSWQELGLRACYLTEQHRQNADDPLLKVLWNMRQNTIGDSDKVLLMGRKLHVNDDITQLFSHNYEVDRINKSKLALIQSKKHKYQMTTSGQKWAVAALTRNLLAPEVLELKVGAEVMFVANNFKEGFVNGTQGKVVKFTKSGYPVVETLEGKRIVVTEHEWQTREDKEVTAKAEQIPLRLAWAMTIHKSQGMSLDAAQIDLSKAFTPGMGYVALSRVRSLHGLYLKGFNDTALTMHEQIYTFDAMVRAASEGVKA